MSSRKLPVGDADTRAEIAEQLRTMIRPGDTVTVVGKSVSSSGMSRRVIVLLARNAKDGSRPGPYILDITWHLGRVGWFDVYEGGNGWEVRLDGAGMDMHFHLVYTLGEKLWPDGYRCTGKRCRSDEHGYQGEGRQPAPRDGRRKHHRPGYALEKASL